MALDVRTDSSDYRVELLSPAPPGAGDTAILTRAPSWRLNFNQHTLPQRRPDIHFGFGMIFQSLSEFLSNSLISAFYSLLLKYSSSPSSSGRQRKIIQYYKRQEELLKGFNEVDEFLELGYLPGSLSEVSTP